MAESVETAYLTEVVRLLRQYKQLAECAVAQAGPEAAFRTTGAEANSIAVLLKHLAGNMRSRWTDFLTADGEKPDRNRDAEFELEPGTTLDDVMTSWEDGWRRAFAALEGPPPRRPAPRGAHRGEAAVGAAGDRAPARALRLPRGADRAPRQAGARGGVEDAEHAAAPPGLTGSGPAPRAEVPYLPASPKPEAGCSRSRVRCSSRASRSSRITSGRTPCSRCWRACLRTTSVRSGCSSPRTGIRSSWASDSTTRSCGSWARAAPTFFERLGAASAEKNLTSLHAGYLTPGDPQAFLAKAPQIYSVYYESGRREYTATAPNAGVLTTYDAETFSAPDCLTVVGWYRKALEMCGAKNVSVTEEECRAKGGAVCRYAVSVGVRSEEAVSRALRAAAQAWEDDYAASWSELVSVRAQMRASHPTCLAGRPLAAVAAEPTGGFPGLVAEMEVSGGVLLTVEPSTRTPRYTSQTVVQST